MHTAVRNRLIVYTRVVLIVVAQIFRPLPTPGHQTTPCPVSLITLHVSLFVMKFQRQLVSTLFWTSNRNPFGTTSLPNIASSWHGWREDSNIFRRKQHFENLRIIMWKAEKTSAVRSILERLHLLVGSLTTVMWLWRCSAYWQFFICRPHCKSRFLILISSSNSAQMLSCKFVNSCVYEGTFLENLLLKNCPEGNICGNFWEKGKNELHLR